MPEQKMTNVKERTVEPTAYVQLWCFMISSVKSFSLKAVVELGIADIIHRHGQPLTASQLAAEIPISSSMDVSCLDRLLCLLVHAGVFTGEQRVGGEETEEVVYGLTPLSRLLLSNSPHSLSPLCMLILHPSCLSAWANLAAWFRKGDGCPTPFELSHGEPAWINASRDPDLNKVLNEAMSSTASKLLIHKMAEGCGDVFEGVSSLVDVGGGNGTSASLIADAFPHIKCTVLDLPHVVAASSPPPNVVAIAGDMFEYVPPADAVLLEEIMHNWDDTECVKILTRCKEAIRKSGGKVIIVDIVKKKWADQSFNEMQLTLDLQMMVLFNSKERSEEEWKKLFIDSGFSNYKIVTSVGVFSLIEAFP